VTLQQKNFKFLSVFDNPIITIVTDLETIVTGPDNQNDLGWGNEKNGLSRQKQKRLVAYFLAGATTRTAMVCV
jgi:hypothetical protein